MKYTAEIWDQKWWTSARDFCGISIKMLAEKENVHEPLWTIPLLSSTNN